RSGLAPMMPTRILLPPPVPAFIFISLTAAASARLRLSWCGSITGRRAELLEQLNEHCALGLRERPRCHIHRHLVSGEDPGRLLFARPRQPNDASPSVARVGLARHQAARLESIHSRGNRSARELDSTANLVYRLRSF